MIELLSGIAIGGVVGVIAKDKIMGGNAQAAQKEREINSLYEEIEKYRQRNKELQREMEDLQTEMNRSRQKNKDAEHKYEDLEDELDRVKKEVRDLLYQNEELNNKIKEYKLACEAQETEITYLKSLNG